MSAHQAPPRSPNASSPTQVPVAEADRRVREGALLLDVREAFEFASVHASDAVNLPLSDLQVRHGELDPNVPVAVICRSGNRSDMAAQFLRQLGFDAVNVVGGMAAWQGSGLPMSAPAADAA